MMTKLKMWRPEVTWEESEQMWDNLSVEASLKNPIKSLTTLPSMPGITPETAKNLKWKSLKWMLTKDLKGEIRKGFFKRPLKYLYNYAKSLFKKRSFKREGDFFLYNINNVEEFSHLMKDPNSILVMGFSYCHKPFECPSGRFTDECIHDANHSICQQCFIGKVREALPEKRTIPLTIPTVHYIGGKIFEIIDKYPNKQILFIITACEMTLQMFGDWGNMVNIKGIGVRLDGRICNTMKAFELSENGIKPGLTVVLDETKKNILKLIREWRKINS